jgi:PE-PPE domain
MPNFREATASGLLKSRYLVITAVLAMVAALLAMSTFTGAISRAANYALGVPGTGNPTPTPSFLNAEVRNFITPTNPACGSGINPPSDASCTQVAVDYPASFWPIILFGLKQLKSDTWNLSVSTGVHNLGTQLGDTYSADPAGQFYLTGYSQGATVLSYFKRNYPTDPTSQGLPPLDQLTLVMAANPNRPNGGLFMRPGIFGPFNIPILNATVGIPAPTDTGVKTTDIAIQYDGVSDFPEYPINLLADANALAGLLFIHPTYVSPNSSHPDGHPYGYTLDQFTDAVTAAQQAADNGQCTDANNCQQLGDTTYITLPTTNLPILAPLRYLGEQTGLSFLTRPLADLVEPVMTVLIETGYDRTSYGTPTPFRLIPNVNPVTLGANLVTATLQGIRDAIGDIDGTRPTPPPTQDPFSTAGSLFANSGGPTAPDSTAAARLAPAAVTPKALLPNVLSARTPLRSSAPTGARPAASGTPGPTRSATGHSRIPTSGTSGTPATTAGAKSPAGTKARAARPQR